MLQSHVIEIDGAFVGAAIRLEKGYRFVAVDLRVEEMDARTWTSLAEIQRVARGLYRISAPPERFEH